MQNFGAVRKLALLVISAFLLFGMRAWAQVPFQQYKARPPVPKKPANGGLMESPEVIPGDAYDSSWQIVVPSEMNAKSTMVPTGVRIGSSRPSIYSDLFAKKQDVNTSRADTSAQRQFVPSFGKFACGANPSSPTAINEQMTNNPGWGGQQHNADMKQSTAQSNNIACLAKQNMDISGGNSLSSNAKITNENQSSTALLLEQYKALKHDNWRPGLHSDEGETSETQSGEQPQNGYGFKHKKKDVSPADEGVSLAFRPEIGTLSEKDPETALMLAPWRTTGLKPGDYNVWALAERQRLLKNTKKQSNDNCDQKERNGRESRFHDKKNTLEGTCKPATDRSFGDHKLGTSSENSTETHDRN